MTEIIDKSAPRIRKALIDLISEIQGTKGNQISAREIPIGGTIDIIPGQALNPKIVPVSIQEFASDPSRAIKISEKSTVINRQATKEVVGVEPDETQVQLVRAGSKELSPFELVQKRKRDKAA